MATFVLGRDGKLYQGAAGAELSVMTELSIVKDVTVNLEAGEVDVTTRGSGGWKASAAGLRECSVEFQMSWKEGDAGLEAIRDAYLSGGQVELAALTGGKGVTNSQGPKGTFVITSFSREEPLDNAFSVKVTAKLAEFDEWVEVA